MSAVEVHISTEGGTHRVGTMFRHSSRRRETVTFAYHEEWVDSKEGFEIDPLVPLGRNIHHPGARHKMFGAFGDTAPDSWGRRLMRIAEQRLAKSEGRSEKTMQETDFILGVADIARQGAIRYRLSEDGGFLMPQGKGVPAFMQVGKLLHVARRVQKGEETDEDLAILLAPGSSLGGARPKAVVMDAKRRLAIAKFPSLSDHYSVETWEHIALTLAGRAGIRVQEHELHRVDKTPVLIARRFDRDRKRRVPFLSAMSMLGAVDHEQRSYPEIVDVLTRYGARPKEDSAELFRRMVFNIMVSNVDDHLRNHGFLRPSAKGWILSPAYDINPTTTKGRVLRTNISLEDGYCSLDLALEQAEYFNLTKDLACNIAGEVATAVSGWRELARSLGESAGNIDMMATAFEHDDLKHGLHLARGSGRPRASR